MLKDANDESAHPPAPSIEKRNHLLIKVTLLLLLVAIFCAFYWFFFMYGTESTDDAYVQGNLININPRVNGTVTAFYADDGDLVEEGQLLVELDPTDSELMLSKAKQELILAVRQVAEMRADIEQRRGKEMGARARLAKAEYDYENRRGLKGSLAISPEEIEHAKIEVEAAKGALQEAEYQTLDVEIRFGKTPSRGHPLIEKAKMAVREAYLNRRRHVILSPARGYVAKRRVQVGEFATPSKSMLSVVPLDQLWVEANFKETQLANVRLGQPVKITADIYGRSVIFKGSVTGISPGTGSTFSLLPPQNATGNWIKIVQRLPIRISLNQEQLQKHPLRLGLSLYVTIDIGDKKGEVLKKKTPDIAIQKTESEETSLIDINTKIDEIIASEWVGNR